MLQLHETVANDAGEMVMQEKQGGFVIPAGGSFDLEPGGNHIMLMDLTAPLAAGDETTFTLTFSDDSTYEFTAPVKDYSGANENYEGGDMDMDMDAHPDAEQLMGAPDKGARRSGSTRRQFLLGGTVAGVGAVAAVGIDLALTTPSGTTAAAPSTPLNGSEIVPFHGIHQAGIDTDAQAHGTFVALDLRDEVDRDGSRRLMHPHRRRRAAHSRSRRPADSEPEPALTPARLTVTFAFGPGFVARAAGTAPAWLQPPLAFAVDRLQDEFSHGDLLIQVAADDPLTVAHATRMLLKDARSFTTVRWTQQGFRRAYGSVAPGTTMRNLFGQVDGTSNPKPGTTEFDTVVWAGEGWLTGGTAWSCAAST